MVVNHIHQSDNSVQRIIHRIMHNLDHGLIMALL